MVEVTSVLLKLQTTSCSVLPGEVQKRLFLWRRSHCWCAVLHTSWSLSHEGAKSLPQQSLGALEGSVAWPGCSAVLSLPRAGRWASPPQLPADKAVEGVEADVTDLEHGGQQAGLYGVRLHSRLKSGSSLGCSTLTRKKKGVIERKAKAQRMPMEAFTLRLVTTTLALRGKQMAR